MSVAPYEMQGLREGLREAWTPVADRLGLLEFVSHERSFAARHIELTLSRLQTPKNVGSTHRSREAFFGLSLRRLGELLGGMEE